ncbi:PQQ-dependent sugar dehydrogenase [Emcibacter sp. SYSU 3D8]|uniref:PQQ-dependent sugar dehydrogenase n=1 Tax=Emcibacter sp. SYSU 3D8 TaxID=3133969 RepID=UPI0031FE5342
MILRGFALVFVLVAGMANARAAELPLDKLTLPAGFGIAVWAEVDGARSMTVGDGFVVVGTMSSEVFAVPFDKQTFKAGKTVTVTKNLSVANGVALLNGVLYIAEQRRVIRWGNAAFDPAKPAQRPVTIGPDLPDKAHHGWRYMAAGPDGALYVTLGSPCNVCMPEGLEGTIIRLDPDTGKAEKMATGLRNSVGVAFHPVTGAMYFTDNGADMMGDNTPPEELNVLKAKGQNFGFPWYGGGKARTRDFMQQQPPADAQFPVAEFNAHSAALGFAFYTGSMFPASYRNHAIVAHHGSWNRTVPIGYRLMDIQMDAAGKVTGVRPFITGWLDRGRAWGRPVDVKLLPDGSMLVSDDYAGVIYRITYGK